MAMQTAEHSAKRTTSPWPNNVLDTLHRRCDTPRHYTVEVSPTRFDPSVSSSTRYDAFLHHGRDLPATPQIHNQGVENGHSVPKACPPGDAAALRSTAVPVLPPALITGTILLIRRRHAGRWVTAGAAIAVIVLQGADYGVRSGVLPTSGSTRRWLDEARLRRAYPPYPT